MLFNFNNSNNKNNKNNELKEYEIMAFPTKNKNFGSFTGTHPKQAAQKAFTFLSSIVGDDIKKDGNFIVFSIRKKNKYNVENTNKELKFIGTIVELENYVRNNVNNDKKVKYKNVVAKYNPELDKIKSTNKNINYNQNQKIKKEKQN